MRPRAAWALALAAALGSPAAAAPARAAGPKYLDWLQVVSVEGTMSLAGRPIGAGYYAKPGERLDVSPGGRVRVKLGEGGVVELRGPAAFRFVRGKRPGLSLERGGALAVLDGLEGPFYIRARSLVAAVKGSAVFFDVKSAGELYVCACRGAIELFEELPGGYRKTLASESHQGYTFRITGTTTVQADRAMEGHSDEDVDALAALLQK